MEKHSLIFIHGMGVGEPNQNYQDLWKLIASHYEKNRNLSSGTFDRHFQPICIEYKDVTYDAKKNIYESSFPNLNIDEPTPWDILRPIRSLRYFMTFFLGDVTAYVSENDNNIRSTFWYQSKNAILNSSYSIIAHSLGSVLAFDFLYNLIEEEELFLPTLSEDLDGFETELLYFKKNIVKIKENFRNLYTFGSPIGLFMMRKGQLWKNGASFSGIINPIHQLDDAQNPHSWLNFYDNEDILSYPLENLFNRNVDNVNRALEDIEIQTGNLVIDSHISYWTNDKMAIQIANSLSF